MAEVEVHNFFQLAGFGVQEHKRRQLLSMHKMKAQSEKKTKEAWNGWILGFDAVKIKTTMGFQPFDQ